MKNKFYASLFLVGSLLLTSKAYSGSAFVGGSINIQNDGYKMKTTVSNISPSVSMIAGYETKINNFGFISEAGVDLSLSTVGKKSKEVTMKSKFHVYLAQKAGYYFNESNLIYVTAGLSVREYVFTIAEKEENAGSFNVILGVGFERAINEKLKLFTEFNNIVSLGDVKIGSSKFKPSSQQFKVGFRYHINYL